MISSNGKYRTKEEALLIKYYVEVRLNDLFKHCRNILPELVITKDEGIILFFSTSVIRCESTLVLKDNKLNTITAAAYHSINAELRRLDRKEQHQFFN